MTDARQRLAAAVAQFGERSWLLGGDERGRGATLPHAPRTPATIRHLVAAWLRDEPTPLLGPHEPEDGAAARRMHALPPLPTGAATVLATSGSSGTPKLAAHTLDQHLASATAAAAWFGLGPQHRWLLALPLHHVGGLAVLFRTLIAGSECAVCADGEDLGELLLTHRPSHVSLVATQLVRLLDHPAADVLAAADAVLLGGGPLPAAVRRRALARGVPLVVSYGATETSSMVTAERDPNHLAQPTCAGRAFEPHQVRITADGEIHVRSPALFAGYLTSDGLDSARTHDGWFATGDVGHLDASGRLFVDGRRDEMFISGGENVHPAAVEAALLELDGITEAVVVPQHDAEFGQVVAAYVALTPGVAPQREAWLEQLRARLPRHELPRAFWRLPPAGTWKRDRAALRGAHAPRPL